MAGSITYLVAHVNTPSSLVTGMGQLMVKQGSGLTINEMAAHMEERPNDALMQHSLVWEVIDPKDSMLPEVIELYKKRPSVALAGALSAAQSKEYPTAAEALGGAGMGSVRRMLSENCLVSIRAKTRSSDVKSFLDSWERAISLNRDRHVPMEDALADGLVVPPEMMPVGSRRYVPLRDVTGILSGERDFKTGTSLRVIDPRETLKRIEPAFRSIRCKTPVYVRRDNACWWAYVKWTEAMEISNGKHTYEVMEFTTPSGKGLSKAAAMASAEMEMIERHSAFMGSESNWPACYVKDLSLKLARHSDLMKKAVAALDPNDFDLPFPYQDQPLHWVEGETVSSEGLKPVYVPAQKVFGRSNLDEPQVFYTTSNGLASGNTMDEAKLHALCELFERDGQYSIFYSPERCFVLGGKSGDINQIIKRYKAKGLKLRMMDATTEFGVPTYIAFVKIGDTVMNGFGAHLDGRIAALRAVAELNGQFASYQTRSRGQLVDIPVPDEKTVDFEALPNYSTGNVEDDLKILERLVISNGLPLTYVDLTRRSMGVPVVRAIMPGFETPFRINSRQIEHLLEFQKKIKKPT